VSHSAGQKTGLLGEPPSFVIPLGTVSEFEDEGRGTCVDQFSIGASSASVPIHLTGEISAT
jgi:hypothetical protein